MRVGEDLHLDVAWVDEVALDVDGRVGEVRRAFATCRLEGSHGLGGGGDDLHPLAAATCCRLDDQRIAQLLAERLDLLGRADGLGRSGNDRNTGFAHQRACGRLRPHQLDRRGGGPIQTSPAASTARAKAAFSARKP